MFGFLSKLPSLPKIFDKLIQIVVKIRCICCGKDIDHVSIPENRMRKHVSFESLALSISQLL